MANPDHEALQDFDQEEQFMLRELSDLVSNWELHYLLPMQPEEIAVKMFNGIKSDIDANI